MAATNLGNIAIVPDGQWSNTKTYTRNRLIYHTNGNSYVARKDVPAGTAITNDEYWQLSGARGLDGDVTTETMNEAIEYAVAQSENGLQEQINDINSGIVGHTSRIVDLEEDVAPIKSVLGGATTAAQARTNLGVTPANIGAAPTIHEHSAADVTSGVLPADRGGTGYESIAALLARLLSDAEGSWTTLTLLNGAANTTLGNGNLRYRKVGNHLSVAGGVTLAWSGTSKIIATLPNGTKYNNQYWLKPCGGNNVARLYVTVGGNLVLEWVHSLVDGSNTTTFDAWVDCNVDFWVD